MTKIITLTKGFKTKVSDEDYFMLSQNLWMADVKKDGAVYARCRKGYMHRILMNAQTGQLVDHINRDTLNNRRNNLRFVTPSLNTINSNRKRGNNKYRGISLLPYGKWGVKLSRDNKPYSFGTYVNDIDAGYVYDVAAKIVFADIIDSVDLNNIKSEEVIDSKLILSENFIKRINTIANDK